MAITKIQSESLNLSDNYDFTGTVTGAGGTNTPAFEAYRTTTQTLAGNNTWTKIQFDTENFDSDSMFDNSTNYRFTPTTAGKYFVYAQCKLEASGVNTNGRSQSAIYFNGSILGESIIDARDTGSNGGSIFTCTISKIISFNGSSDYVEIYAKCFDNTGTTPKINTDNNGDNVFGAFKIIE